jgi:hypothetical protein
VATSTIRRTVRLVLLTICALAIVALVGTIVRQSAQTNSTAAALVDTESDGATSLHPMLALLGALVEAQSAAVGDASMVGPTTDVNNALNQISGLDPSYGRRLETDSTVTDLTGKVQALLAQHLTGRAAYDGYSGLVTLSADLMRRTADTSHLIHDPEADAYFVMSAAVVQLPDALINAGRAADLVAMGGGKALTGGDGVSAAVARYNVANAADQVSVGLHQSVDNTASAGLGSDIAGRLDAFMAAAAAFAPPTMLQQLLLAMTNPATFTTDADNVHRSALSLAHFLISELQQLLAARAGGLAAQWRTTATLAGAAVLVALLMVWLLAARNPRGSHARPGLAAEPSERADDVRINRLTDAQRLLDQDWLARVGQSAHQRDRGSGDAF